MMTEQPDFSAWIGRIETSPSETLTPRLLDRFRASLSPHLTEIGAAPAGIHWCLSPHAVEAVGLGPDGHPAKGGFLPPVPLPRRMWAGGEIEFIAPLRERDEVTRVSRIGDVQTKTGRSGTLCFVTVHHEINTERGTAMRERHDIVYRAAATAPTAPAHPDARGDADAEWSITVDPVLLFRYSALTFNGHRIHYDEAYARDVEFYPGLVIHGPLQATVLLNLSIAVGGSTPRRFAFRGVSAACGTQTLRARAWKTENGLELATITAGDVTAMTAIATW
ncbi:MaoC family dehydratase N-terminal domain-containing protein [Ochrobactrum sp. RH2CCR150]|uniref:FAS1-like dehydratase domain-containing protein n=1 Tax=Ochrobactrum sp. RH2CCR150 TaxID=2587044 RepID=UPI0015FE7168|nr:3-methylfumaryl-CoA hydratase [Ochrobactrum sp. RH2CCR150]